MASFDIETKTFKGETFPKIFHPEAPLGQVILYICYQHPEKVIQISADDGLQIKCKELSMMMKQTATFLSNMNLNLGDVVSFCARNTSYLAPTVLGCILQGLAINPVDVSHDIDAIVVFFRQTKPKLVFCDSDQVTKIQKALKELENDATIVVLTEKLHDFRHVAEIFSIKPDVEKIPQNFGTTTDKICVAIIASSGSTGAHKLIRLTQAQLLESTAAIGSFVDDTLSFDYFCLFYGSGFYSIVHGVLNLLPRLITREPFSAKHCIESTEKFKVGQLILIPNQIVMMTEQLKTQSADLSSVKILATGAWHISEQTIKLIESKLPNGRVGAGYGMTEAGGVVTRTNTEDPISSSVGKPCANTEIRILLSDGTFGGVGDYGEVLMKKTFNIIDYLNNEEQTRALIDDDGWIHSADIGHFDENLRLFHAGREKFMIRSHNRRVNPIELEAIIGDLEGVRKVCVVALPHVEAFEVPAAVVERHENSRVTVEEIRTAVEHLEHFKQLIGGVYFVDQLPVTISGKVERYSVLKIALGLAKKS